MRIWRNDYQFLFSVRGKWFWACVKTDLGSWWQISTSSSCSSCKRVQSLCWSCCKLSAPLPSQAPCCKLCGPAQGPVWLQTSYHHTASTAAGCCCYEGIGEIPPRLPVASWLTHLHHGLWCMLSSHLLLLLGYICFWVGELFSWILFSQYVQSKQRQCSGIAASAVNIA